MVLDSVVFCFQRILHIFDILLKFDISEWEGFFKKIERKSDNLIY